MRKAQQIIVLGTNGTGKTTIVRDLIDKINSRALIVTPDPMEWQDVPIIKTKELQTFTGKKRIIYYNGLIKDIFKNVFNAIIVFDDFKALFIENQDEIKALKSLSIRRRQHMIDIFIIAHGFTEIVPSFLYTFTSKIILFRTLDNIARVKYRILDYERTLEAQKQVNSSKKKHFFKVINYE